MQMDLFTPVKPVATIITFPVDRRQDRIRAIAGELAKRDFLSGQRYWAACAKGLRRELRETGMPTADIEATIQRVATAVSRVLHLQKQYGSTPDSAA